MALDKQLEKAADRLKISSLRIDEIRSKPASQDQMQEWLEAGASDGFTLQFPYLPQGLDDVIERVIPELQRRGLFRREYEGPTLRENLGVPRPANRFFAAPRG